MLNAFIQLLLYKGFCKSGFCKSGFCSRVIINFSLSMGEDFINRKKMCFNQIKFFSAGEENILSNHRKLKTTASSCKVLKVILIKTIFTR